MNIEIIAQLKLINAKIKGVDITLTFILFTLIYIAVKTYEICEFLRVKK